MKIEKYLYQFSINKESELEETVISTNEKGEQVKTLKKVKEIKPISFRILKPNRRLFDEAELFYGIKLSEGIKAGLLTRPLLAKRYQNDGGAMSDSEKQKYATLYIELYRYESDLQQIQLNLEKISRDEQIAKISEVLTNINETKKELQQIENYQSTLFDQTAENRARNQTIMWWVLNLSYISKDDKGYTPFFGEGSYEEKINRYDEYEEGEDLFNRETMSKLAYFISLWYLGKANNNEDFKNLESLFNQSTKSEETTDKKENSTE